VTQAGGPLSALELMPRFKIVRQRSRLWVEARSSLHPIKADSGAIDGYVEAAIDGAAIDLKVPMQARIDIDAATLRSGNILYDRELERRLEIRNYPRISGAVVEVSEIGPGRLHVSGEVALHGVTKAVEGEVNVRVLDDTTLQLEGEKVFDMRDFGLTPPRILMLKVYPEVKVRGRFVAEKMT
jgi:polyisoprenoid-binding protein YceI